MGLQRLKFKIPPELAGRRLDEALVVLLSSGRSPVSKAQARKLIVAGAVYLNGRRVRIASKPVIVGAEVSAHVDFARLETGAVRSEKFREGWKMSSSSILFEDDWLIAVNKPAGLPTQPTIDEARLNLYAALQKFIREREADPHAYVGLHHRLDRDTSGVVLFTKRKEANPGVSDLFSKHLARKEYRALCSGRAELKAGSRFEIRNFLKRLPGKVSRFGSARSGGDLAHTDFEVATKLADGPHATWELRCWPRTGRTHQIRVHLSEMGLPILGDIAYGGKGGTRLMLHAAALEFPHPMTGAKVRIESPIPGDFESLRQRLSGERDS
jgi:23S rRNA pseudouridine1911/1915/1917 synthase